MSSSSLSEYGYGEEIPCDRPGCEGTALYEKNGSQCESCFDWNCEHCACSYGHYCEEEDSYYCPKCECPTCNPKEKGRGRGKGKEKLKQVRIEEGKGKEKLKQVRIEDYLNVRKK